MSKSLRIEELLKTLQSRRSIRQFQPTAVPAKAIDLMLEAARWAPSAHNRQPWRFIVIFDKSIQKQLLKGMAIKYRYDLECDGTKKDLINQIVAEDQKSIRNADVLIIGGIDMTEMDQYPDPFRQQCEREMAIQSFGAAVQNLLLAAHIQGIGSCWRCAPLFCPKTIKETLDLPTSFEPQALITLGYPKENIHPTPRKPLSNLVTFIPSKK